MLIRSWKILNKFFKPELRLIELLSQRNNSIWTSEQVSKGGGREEAE